jgi:hypothetical protein
MLTPLIYILGIACDCSSTCDNYSIDNVPPENIIWPENKPNKSNFSTGSYPSTSLNNLTTSGIIDKIFGVIDKNLKKAELVSQGESQYCSSSSENSNSNNYRNKIYNMLSNSSQPPLNLGTRLLSNTYNTHVETRTVTVSVPTYIHVPAPAQEVSSYVQPAQIIKPLSPIVSIGTTADPYTDIERRPSQILQQPVQIFEKQTIVQQPAQILGQSNIMQLPPQILQKQNQVVQQPIISQTAQTIQQPILVAETVQQPAQKACTEITEQPIKERVVESLNIAQQAAAQVFKPIEATQIISDTQALVKEPVQVFQRPIQIVQQPAVVTPTIAEQSAVVQVVQQPALTQPVQVVQQPALTQPVQVVQQPALTQPVQVVQQPALTQPVQVVQQPALTQPVQVVQQPALTQPVQVVQQPAVIPQIQLVEQPAVVQAVQQQPNIITQTQSVQQPAVVQVVQQQPTANLATTVVQSAQSQPVQIVTKPVNNQVLTASTQKIEAHTVAPVLDTSFKIPSKVDEQKIATSICTEESGSSVSSCAQKASKKKGSGKKHKHKKRPSIVEIKCTCKDKGSGLEDCDCGKDNK